MAPEKIYEQHDKWIKSVAIGVSEIFAVSNYICHITLKGPICGADFAVVSQMRRTISSKPSTNRIVTKLKLLGFNLWSALEYAPPF